MDLDEPVKLAILIHTQKQLKQRQWLDHNDYGAMSKLQIRRLNFKLK